ncbi:hypothetical protein MTO96_024865 [Rhipicephalus appendiculatus]
MPPTITAERETGAAEEIVKYSPPEATLREKEEAHSLANPRTPCLPASLTRKEDTMDDGASTLSKHNVPCLPASPADKQTLVGADALAASLIPAADCAVVSDIPKSDAGVSSDAVSKPNEPNTPVLSESQAHDFLDQVARRHGNSLLTRLDKQPAVKVVGGDNVDPAALPLPESSESSFSLGVDSSIELSPSLDECDVEMLAPREVKRAHTTGTSSDGSQDSRSESQQPKKPRPSSRGPKCVV